MKSYCLNEIRKTGKSDDQLLEILIEIQSRSEHNYVSKEAMKEVASFLNIPEAKVYEVATFYSMLSTKPRGKNLIQICGSPSCCAAGKDGITKAFEEALGVKMGEVTKDGLFSLEYTGCIGACDIAPAAKINGVTYGNLNADKINSIISKIKAGGEL